MQNKLPKNKYLLILLLMLSVCIVLAGLFYKRSLAEAYLWELGLVADNIEKPVSMNPGYDGKLTSRSRYLAIGFDDFRGSDFEMVEPILETYRANATFNRISHDNTWSIVDSAKMNQILMDGNEVGDHTWFHCNYIYMDPLCNGQNPDHPEGNQVPYPANDQLRRSCRDGKNAFGYDVDRKVSECSEMESYGIDWSAYEVEWKNLTDEQCQEMRDQFSFYKDTTGMLSQLDELSNLYLGTEGSSYGSWDDKEGCYTGGIFTGCKSSCNHEIWERILKITRIFYQKNYSAGFSLYTWSWPGGPHSPFVYEKNGYKYYDPECTKFYNFNAKFRLEGCNSDGKLRSWNDCLREAGYVMTHDSVYPSRFDGTETVMMSKQFIYNAALSRRDAVVYPTNRCISYSDIAAEYPEKFFHIDSSKSAAEQMYEAGGSFYRIIEDLRGNTSNGMIQGEVIDSVDTYSERMFLSQLLEYCNATGVEVVSKRQAYDICFHQSLTTGNLIYNPDLVNTAAEFMPDADNIPSNPDGYKGGCHVIDDDGPTLVADGETSYLHYGIPLGKIRYSCEAMGEGSVTVYGIKNESSVDLNNEELTLLAQGEVHSDDFKSLQLKFDITDNAEQPYEPVCEGLGQKYMGIKIVYSGGVRVRNLQLERI